ncbi:ROK family protein [Paenibacillus sp. MBLB4367]|uniref:ROK family protein n=1 Tax=Paenibacillus sp. MBLB4367 TaxID=3384767 RepID=UPI0039080BEC
MGYRIGIDLGGTNIVYGLIGGASKIVDVLKEPTEAHRGSDDVLRKIAEGVRLLIVRNGLKLADIEAVGAGVPGLVDPDRGVCIGSSNLHWRDVEVARQLENLLGMQVYIDNDVRMYVMGEALYGAGRGHRYVLGVTLGTGIAAGLLCDGRPYYGAGKMAGELGHIPMDGELETCGCGMTGCLETVASATGLARQARQLMQAGRASVLAELAGGNIREVTAAHISRAYDMGDAVATEIMHHTGRMLGKGLSYAVTLYNPDVIVVGGGAANAGERLLAKTREELHKRVLRMYAFGLDIKTAELGDYAGVVGSAANAAWMMNKRSR